MKKLTYTTFLLMIFSFFLISQASAWEVEFDFGAGMIGEGGSIAETVTMPLDGRDANILAINNTGESWTDFHFSIDGGYFDENYGYEGPSGAVWTYSGDGNDIDIVGLIIPDDDYAMFGFVAFGDLDTGEKEMPFTLTAYPTADPVPEPATMLLLGSGLVGLAGFRRRFRKK